MKTINKYIATLLLLTLTLSLGAAPVKFTTNKALGESLTIALNSGITVSIDWNNGKNETFVSEGDLKTIEVKGTSAEINVDRDITSLYLGNNGITELTFDITAYTLKQLYCPQNALTTLDLSNCLNLVELDCQGNQLKDITIVSNVLESCNLSDNKLAEITIPNNSEYIKTLVLSGNAIAKLEGLDNMKNLSTLFIANNKMTSVSLENNKKIRHIVAYNNELTNLQTNGLKNLNQIWVSNNQLKELDVTTAKDLVSIKADNNNLSQIKWTKECSASFKFIDVSENSLFFNSLPTIYDAESNKPTIEAYVLPQRPYFMTDGVVEDIDYDRWKDVLTVNGWEQPTTLQTTINDKNGVLAPNNYSIKDGVLKFKSPQEQVEISATSAAYPGITLKTTPFEVKKKGWAVVTFKYIYNGETIATENKPYQMGTVINSLPTAHEKDFCKYEFEKKMVESLKDTIDVKVTWDGPFEFSESFEKAKWYLLTINSSDKRVGYLRHTDNQPINLTSDASSVEYYWAFMGNPLNIKVINLSQGKDKCLNNTPDYPRMETADYSWTIFAANAQKGKFLLKSKERGYTAYTGNTIKYSSKSTQGAHFIVEKAPDLTDNYADKVVKEISPFFDSKNLGHYFELSKEAYEANKDKVKAAEGYANEMTYNQLKKILLENIIYPTDGFYRFKNVSTNGYLHAKSKAALHSDGDANSVEAVVEIRSELPPGTYYKEEKPFLLIQDKWCSNTVTNNTTYLMDKKGNFLQYLPVAPGKFAFAIAYYNARPGWEQYLEKSYYTVGKESQVFGSEKQPTAENTESIWTIEEATNATLELEEIGNAYYGTFFAPYAISVENGSANTLRLKDGAGQLQPIATTVPAKTPMIILSSEKEANITIHKENVSAIAGTNILEGNLLPADHQPNFFYLGQQDNVAGFYSNGIETRTYNNAFVSTTHAVKGFALDITATGIEHVTINKDTIVYDLQGRRVQNPRTGIYIINNKKVYVK